MLVYILVLILETSPSLVVDMAYEFSSMKECQTAKAFIIADDVKYKRKLRCLTVISGDEPI